MSLFVGPLLLLIVRATGDDSQRPMSFWLVIGATLLGPALHLLGAVSIACLRVHVRRDAELGMFDAQLATQDRLVSADEFIYRTGALSGFEQAAIEDATPYIQSALAHSLRPLPLPRWRVRPISALGAVLAVVLSVLLMIPLGEVQTDPRAAQSMLLNDAGSGKGDTLSASDGGTQRRPQQNRRAQTPTEAAVSSAASAAKSPDASPRTDDSIAQGDSNSLDSPTGTQSTAKASRSDEPATARAGESVPTRLAMDQIPGEGGASTVAGSSMPSDEKQPPTQQSGSAPKEIEPAADASNEAEQRRPDGAATPAMRDRKAPADRNASTSPSGDSPRTDANGRGGAGGRKKTRGVPSMILGIPVVDRVQGMASPGSAKVTRERAVASPEPISAEQGEEHRTRSAPSGEVIHPALTARMQAIVREYFLAARDQTEGESE